jgi:hydroxymethylglutaryl-CoA lyase
VDVVEVAPRDGLQNEQVMLPTDAKVELVRRAEAAGIRRIEVASFVNPARVPQMADGEAVVAALGPSSGVTRIGLVLNRRGMERAVAAGVDEVNYVVVVTDTFSRRNQGMSTDESLVVLGEVAEAARAAALPCSVTLSASFGCPFEGEVAVSRLVEVASRAMVAQPTELSLADTIGVAVPSDVRQRVDAVRREIGDVVPLRCHFHNTRNTGIASALAAAEAGVGALDASLGGIGGCPFAPNATGNIPTEDLVYALERSGFPTGLDLAALSETAVWLGAQLGRTVPGLLSRAGPFPPAAA